MELHAPPRDSRGSGGSRGGSTDVGGRRADKGEVAGRARPGRAIAVEFPWGTRASAFARLAVKAFHLDVANIPHPGGRVRALAPLGFRRKGQEIDGHLLSNRDILPLSPRMSGHNASNLGARGEERTT